MGSLSQARDFDQAIDALDGWLRDENYTRRSRDGIAAHIRQHGELVGASPEYLDREHIEPATEILVGSFPAVPPDSEDWSDSGRWTPNDAYRIEPPELDGDDFPDGTPDEYVTRALGYREALERDGITPLPISGGAPDFVPSEADWADYREWTEWVDRLDALPDDEGDRQGE